MDNMAVVASVVSTLALFNEVNRQWARLVLVWVTVYGQVRYMAIHLGRLSLLRRCSASIA